MGEFVGKRIVPRHEGEWDNTRSYEPLMIVLDPESGDGYISRYDVPAGTALTNTHYWALCSHFHAQMNRLETDLDADVTAMQRDVANAKQTMSTQVSDALSTMTQNLNQTQNRVEQQLAQTQSSMSRELAATHAAMSGELNSTKAEMSEELDTAREAMAEELNQTEKVLTDMTEQSTSAMETARSEMNNAVAVLTKRLDANVTARTEANKDYAAEVVDARVGTDGTQYDSAGAAIRAQIQNLLDGNIEKLNAATLIMEHLAAASGDVGLVIDGTSLIADGCYVNNAGVLTSLGKADQHTGFIPVDQEHRYYYVGYLEGGGRAICAYADETEESFIACVLAGIQGSAAQVRKVFLDIPENAKFLRISCNGEYSNLRLYQMSKYAVDSLGDAFNEEKIANAEAVLNLRQSIAKAAADIRSAVAILSGGDDNYLTPVAGMEAIVSGVGMYLNTDGTPTKNLASKDDRYTEFIEVEPEARYLYQGYVYDAGRAFAFYREASEDTLIHVMSPARTGEKKYLVHFQVPKEAHFARFTCYRAEVDYPFALYKDIEGFDVLCDRMDELESISDSLNQKVVYYDKELIFKAESNADLISGFFMNSAGKENSSTFGDYVTEYLPIEPDRAYVYRGIFSDARALCQYDSEKNLVWSMAGSSLGKGDHYEYAFVSHPKAAYFRGTSYRGTGHTEVSLTAIEVSLREQVSVINDRFNAKCNELVEAMESQQAEITEAVGEQVAEIKESVETLKEQLTEATPADYEAFTSGHIFATDNVCAKNSSKSSWYARNYVQTMYPESFLRDKLPLYLNGTRSWNIQSVKKNSELVESWTSSMTLGNAPGYSERKMNVQVVTTKNSVLGNNKVRYLAIGDSLQGNTIPDYEGEYTVGWNHSSEARRFALMDIADLNEDGDVLCVGTLHYTARANFSYGGQNISMKACDEGRGSWSTPNYLRHFAHTTTTGSGNGSSFHNKIAWDSLGLGRKIVYGEEYSVDAPYEEYTYSVDQRKLIQNTPHGYYHWDYSEELWAYLKTKRPSYFSKLTGYLGNKADFDAIDLAMEDLLENPDNPFFDWETARATGKYAFCLSTYLERYRTLADDGETRLTVGTTAGSKVTASSLNSWDVCMPTHITIELGENDRWWFPNDPDQAAADNLLMMEAIHREYPAIHVGFVTTRMMGVFYPERWNDVAILNTMSVSSNNFKYNLNKRMAQELGTLEEQTAAREYLIPTYETHSALSFSKTRRDEVLATGDKILVGISGDINHSGCGANASIGYQTLSWIYYTLAKSQQ